MVSDQEFTSTVDDSVSLDDSDTVTAPNSPILARDRRRQTLLFLCFSTTLFVVAGLWWYDYFETSVIVPEKSDPPGVRFEKLYQANLKTNDSKLHIEGFPTDDSMVSQIAELESLETLIIDEGIVTDEAIALIAKLPKLRQLRLRLSPIGDAGFLHTPAAPWSYCHVNHRTSSCSECPNRVLRVATSYRRKETRYHPGGRQSLIPTA